MMNAQDTPPSPAGQAFEFFQLEFSDTPGAEPEAAERDPLEEWRSAREAQLERLAIDHGLPLGRQVSVELRGGRYLEGRLLLSGDLPPGATRADAMLDLRIGSVRFHAAEIITCIRLD